MALLLEIAETTIIGNFAVFNAFIIDGTINLAGTMSVHASQLYAKNVSAFILHGYDKEKKHLVNFGDACTYSMNPLKNLNVWGDGVFIATNNKKLAKKLYLIRNHGLKDRNNVEIFGYNSRLDTIQAAVANYKMKNKLDNITSKRIKNAKTLDKLLSKNKNVTTVKRLKYLKEVFHLYHIII